MRALILVACIASALVAGCLDDEPTSGTSLEGGAEAAASTVPEAMEFTGSATAQVSPGPMLQSQGQAESWCEHGCEEFPFTLNGSASADIQLTWGIEANDFDLVLMDSEGNEIAVSGNGPDSGEALEQVTAGLEPGDYVIGVVPFAVAQDDFQVQVTFS